MALAIDIKAKVAEEPRISVRSWQQNPMGVLLSQLMHLFLLSHKNLHKNKRVDVPTIQYGHLDFLVDLKVGACDLILHGVNLRIDLQCLHCHHCPFKNSDGGGGIVTSNTWQVDFPYAGFYGFKGTGDNRGRILIDGQEVYKLRGFKNPSPEIVKRKITAGNHEGNSRDRESRSKKEKEGY